YCPSREAGHTVEVDPLSGPEHGTSTLPPRNAMVGRSPSLPLPRKCVGMAASNAGNTEHRYAGKPAMAACQQLWSPRTDVTLGPLSTTPPRRSRPEHASIRVVG